MDTIFANTLFSLSLFTIDNISIYTIYSTIKSDIFAYITIYLYFLNKFYRIIIETDKFKYLIAS